MFTLERLSIIGISSDILLSAVQLEPIGEVVRINKTPKGVALAQPHYPLDIMGLSDTDTLLLLKKYKKNIKKIKKN